MSSGYLRGVGARRTRNRSCGQFFPLTGRSEAVEVHQRDAVDYGVADLDDAAEPGQSLLVDLVGQKFRVVEEIAQKPAQFPHRLLCAVEPTDNGLSGQSARFYDRESEHVERFVGVPTELGAIDPNKEDDVGNRRA